MSLGKPSRDLAALAGSLIPTIDLTNDPPSLQADTIKHALGSVGFFAVRNPPEGPSVQETLKLFESTFFNLPMEKKEEYLAGPSGSGYNKLLGQALGEGRRDHKETFSYGKFCSTTTQPLPPPFSTSSSASASLKQFYKSCHQTSERLMELFALALELPKEHFKQCHSWGEYTALSLVHYPQISADKRLKLGARDIRAGEHKDWGTLTMLFQQPDGEPGLEVYLPPSAFPPEEEITEWAWYPAPVPPAGTFLVNVGLGMELWSGGNYKATLHRVVFPTQPTDQIQSQELNEHLADRYTLAFFVQPDDKTPFQPVGPGGKIDTSVKAITSGELFDFKLKESRNRTILLDQMDENGDHSVLPSASSYTINTLPQVTY